MSGQETDAAESRQSTAESQQGALQAGLELERQREWGDAIQHYESSLRRHPSDAELEQRLLISRLHFDVIRRYQDTSFMASLRKASTQQTLDLYAEILANLETHYVDAIDWQRTQLHGTASLEVALTEDLFIDRLLADVPAEQVEAFRQDVHRHLIGRPASTRFDLRANAAYVAGLAHRELGIPGTAVVYEYICGAVGTLDPYSRLLTSDQLDETFSNIDGNFVGLGVELKAREDRLRVVDVIEGGPADTAGIRPGESITRVEDSLTASVDPDYVADLLRGPENSFVSITVVDHQGRSRDLKVPRRRVEVPSVTGVRIVDKEHGVGYLRLTNFQRTTSREFEKALWDLHEQKMRHLIVDIRGNPGGLLSAAVEVADRFLSEGNILLTRGRSAQENFDYAAHRANTWSVPLTLLIDRDSASASEIFAGAIADHGRGILIGETTFGKGRVQGIFRMQSGRVGLCLTTAKFYSPNRTEINGRGIAPTISATTPYIAARPTSDGRIATIEEDVVLQRALQHARGEDPSNAVASRPSAAK
ncbi:MAG: S41 family peptidase [Pirellulaceae bacterium]